MGFVGQSSSGELCNLKARSQRWRTLLEIWHILCVTYIVSTWPPPDLWLALCDEEITYEPARKIHGWNNLNLRKTDLLRTTENMSYTGKPIRSDSGRIIGSVHVPQRNSKGIIASMQQVRLSCCAHSGEWTICILPHWDGVSEAILSFLSVGGPVPRYGPTPWHR